MELLHRVIYSAVGALSFFIVLVKFSLAYWKRRGILHQKPAFFWGNLKGVVTGKRHTIEALQNVYKTYKGRAPFIGFYACLKPFVFVLDLQLVRQILVTDAGNFTTRGLYSNPSAEPLSGNLLQMDGHKWRALHAQTSTVYTMSNLQKLLPALLNVATKFQSNIVPKERNPTSFNISNLVDSYNSDVIATLAFGLSGKNLETAQAAQFHQMSHNYNSNFSLWKEYLALEFPLLARLFCHKSYAEEATAYFEQVVASQLKKQGSRDNRQWSNFLQIFCALEQPPNSSQIAAQAFGFILAGLVPLNATLSFCLFELALQPEIQERTRAEIRKVLEKHNGLLSWECLSELKYTKQVIKETLRLHTPYPFLLRRCTRSYEVPNSVFMVARGNNVIIPTAAIHRDAAIYDEPLRFNPERFDSTPVRFHTKVDVTFLPFGAGLRGCIASQFAELQLLVGLVVLLQHNRYTPCTDTAIPLEYDTRKLLLVPKTDIQLNVERESS